MNSIKIRSLLAATIGLTVLPGAASAADAAASTLSAAELAGRMNTLQQDGSSYVRLRMQAPKTGTLQLQIKERRAGGTSALVYQVLWPKERQGEAVLLRKGGNGALTGAVFTPPNTTRNLSGGEMSEGLFGSDLSYEDAIDNFFAWSNQAIVGSEAIGRANCQILESKPGKGQRSSYASVRTWLDTRRMVPLRIEKLNASGQVVKRIETSRVATDDIDRQIPATLVVNGRTELEGSKIKHDVSYTDREFTTEGLKEGSTVKASQE